MNKTYPILSLFAFILCVVGCQPSGIKGLVPCSGTVLDKSGQPVAEVTITFVPQSLGESSRGAGAKTDANGAFTTTTESGNGIFPGDYKVKLSKRAPDKVYTDEEIANARESGQDLPVTYKEQMGKYASPDTSGLVVTIPPKGNKNLEIKLEE